MINKEVLKYLTYATELISLNKDINSVIEQLKIKGATYAVTFKVLEKIGYDIKDIDTIIRNSQVWKGSERSFEDLFFDFLELDDDLIIE